ncbi:hypothetical protein FA13DRAFT_1783898 [Coprinellus micaceus]|uniref:Uncharacterized protein n=1 Tax=Coprinellus micaceus TaxID=71717 RepID=A0A4Y7R814_COPMI|nr:hypothetical protein FA13DRAFT_1783898 [Coprinellus micaceus]
MPDYGWGEAGLSASSFGTASLRCEAPIYELRLTVLGARHWAWALIFSLYHHPIITFQRAAASLLDCEAVPEMELAIVGKALKGSEGQEGYFVAPPTPSTALPRDAKAVAWEDSVLLTGSVGEYRMFAKPQGLAVDAEAGTGYYGQCRRGGLSSMHWTDTLVCQAELAPRDRDIGSGCALRLSVFISFPQ